MFAARPLIGDPTADAARLLCRLALIILLIVTPAAELVSRGALYVLLPVGATVLIIAGWLSTGWPHWGRLGSLFLTPIGLAALFLAIWSVLSLAWTPYPAEAGPRLAKALGTSLIALFAIILLPERTRAPNLYLLPIGVAVTAIATGLVIVFGPQSFSKGASPDNTLAYRCLISAAILVWPALGALALRERWLIATGLAAVVTVAALTGFLRIALVAIAGGAFVYVIAVTDQRRTAKLAAFVLAALVLLAPILAFIAFMLADLTQHGAPARAFADAMIAQWPRLITGHGFDTAANAIQFGALPSGTPRSILFTIWYELGLLGAVAFAMLGYGVFLAAGRAPPHVAPALLAGLVAGLAIALWGAETTQIWWITLNGLDAIAFALLFKGHPRARRPRAPVIGEDADREFES